MREKLWEILQLKENGWRESSNKVDRKVERAAMVKSVLKNTYTATQKSLTEKVVGSSQTELSKSTVTQGATKTSSAAPSAVRSSSSTRGDKSAASNSAARSKSSTRGKTGDERSNASKRRSLDLCTERIAETFPNAM